jgi:biopolymer transport protein ExbB/TolQ/DNA-directed RNA polymerase subunit RPC12/RpoP
MYFRFGCDKCGKKLKVDEEHAGQKARCPYCRSTQLIPDPHSEESQSRIKWGEPTGASEAKDDASQAGQASEGVGTGESGSSQEKQKRGLFSRLAGQESNTDVSPWKSGLIGVWLTALVYLALYPVRDSVGVLFYGRGWVPVILTLLLCWAFGIIILKYFKVQQQRDAMLFDVLPTEIGDEITLKNLPQFMQHVRDLPMNASESFFINRVMRGLEHFRVRQSVTEVGTVLESQSEIDNNAVASSYSLLHVFLWAIPIMGFIGTVLGISTAVASFSGTIGEAGELSAMKESLGQVMGGLGTAFDTTLLALCMAVVLIFPMKSVQKAEESLLNSVDEYTNENLLKRLKEAGEAQQTAGSTNQQEIQRAIHQAMADHHAELRTWTKKLDAITEQFKEKAGEEWKQIHQRLMEEHQSRESSLSQTLDKIAEKQTQTAQDFTEKYEKLMSQFDQLQQQIQELQKQEADHITHMQEQVADSVKSIRDTAQALQSYVGGVGDGLSSLNEVLKELDGKTVTVERPRRRLFSFGK